MTAMTRLLRQRPALCERAIEATRDVNEAYLIVHQVMTRAFSSVREQDYDLGPCLGLALDKRSARAASAGLPA